MGTTFNKAIVAGLLPFILALVNEIFGTEFVLNDMTEAIAFGLINALAVYFMPNRNTVYLDDRVKTLFDRFLRQQAAPTDTTTL